VQVDPIKPMLKAPKAKRLNLKIDEPHSSFAFKCNLRRYTEVRAVGIDYLSIANMADLVGRCRLAL
jgi:hypothetical protein